MRSFIVVALGAVLAARAVTAQIVGPSGYIVGSIALPGTAQGDVEVAGTAIVVGQGSFGAGTESVIRRDADGTITTLATGFNSLSSFAQSAGGDVLFVTDNGGSNAGATTGNTVFAIEDPRAASAPVTANGREVAAAGSVPFASGLAIGPDGEVYVGSAAGGTSGSVLKHRSILVPPFASLATGFGYTGGLAFGSTGHLFVGDVDSTTFAGRVVELDESGALVHTLASSLSGAFDQAFNRNGSLLVSGGFGADFSSTIVSITPSGTVSEFAHGFTFSTGLTVDPVGGRVYALDSGSSQVATFTPIDSLIPGGGVQATDCFAEFSDTPAVLTRQGRPTSRSVCHDGDACDRDGVADGVCTFAIGVCFNVSGNSKCAASGVESFTVTPPPRGTLDPQFAALAAAAGALMPSTSMECTNPVEVTVPMRLVGSRRIPASRMLRTVATHTPAGGRAKSDRDMVTLRCLP